MDEPRSPRSRSAPLAPGRPAGRAGADAETAVAALLAARGWSILARNVRAGRSELDLVAIDPGPPRSLVVVEVRARTRRDFDLPEETLDRGKRSVLRRGIGHLLGAGRLPDGRALPGLPVRFDLVAVDLRTGRLRHHRAADLAGGGAPDRPRRGAPW